MCLCLRDILRNWTKHPEKSDGPSLSKEPHAHGERTSSSRQRTSSSRQESLTVKTTRSLTPSYNENSPTSFDVPHGYGLIISLSSGTCWLKLTEDWHATSIHPNCHVPATLRGSLESLGGGGSGVKVMRAADPEFGSTVLKHGAGKDVEELFALATVEEELRARGEAAGSAASTAATLDLVRRTPDFKFIYISRSHLCDDAVQLRRKYSESPLARRASHWSAPAFSRQTTPEESLHIQGLRVCNSAYRREHARSLTRYADVVSNDMDHFLEIYLDADDDLDSSNQVRCSVEGKGFEWLQNFVQSFIPLQESNSWKVTLAQKAIGDSSSKTGSAFLAEGILSGNRLTILVDQMLEVIHHLIILTFSKESNAIDDVRKDLQAIAGMRDGPSHISQVSDWYVGRAITKNFHPEIGRFKNLRLTGELFRREFYQLTEESELPAQKLGVLLDRGARIEKVFGESVGPTALDTFDDAWLDVLEHATSVQGSRAVAGVWTGGITDGGLHNLFLDENYVWLFDMGSPAVMSVPALLTKFLFSFYHTLGMEDEANGKGWVNRFLPGEVLNLTAQTKIILPKAREAFISTLDRFVNELFDGEQRVRELLMKYVVLQLLSDCSFCLERWEIKGGGSKRAGLEMWLWRALWDLYTASDVANRDMMAGKS